MKNVIIINSYANTLERRTVLFNCINNLKKLNIDIILVSNYTDDFCIKSLVNHYLYDSDNFLLPKEKSPLNWFADEKETIHVYHPGTSYIVYKNICTAINYAYKCGYNKFFYLEFDCIFSDEDLILINSIFNNNLHNKKLWLCNYSTYDKLIYESRLFAGDVVFFLENFVLVNSYEDWCNKDPFSTSSESLEYIFPLLVQNLLDSIELTGKAVCDFFKKSKFDLCHSFSHVYISYNNEIPTEPLVFITTNSGYYEIIINDIIVHSGSYLENSIVKYKFIISEKDTNVKVKFNDTIVFEKNVNHQNIHSFAKKCIRYKL